MTDRRSAERVSAYGICSDIEGWSTDEFMKSKQTEIEPLRRVPSTC
ncbi:MAG: hypothetical protein ACYC1M_13120 [Armatimonadota bacterium]